MLLFLKFAISSQSSTLKSAEDDSTKRLEQEDIEEKYSSETVSRQPDLYKASSHFEKDSDDDMPETVQRVNSKISKCTSNIDKIVADLIQHQDSEYLKFEQASEKAMWTGALCKEIVKRESNYFQDSARAFVQKRIDQ